MDPYTKEAAALREAVKEINRAKAARYIARELEGQDGLDDVLGALGLTSPDPAVRSCPHCGRVLPDSGSRCSRSSCRGKIAALNRAGRTEGDDHDDLD